MIAKKLDIFIDTTPIPHAHLKNRSEYAFHYELDQNKVYDVAIFINTPTKKIKIKVKKGNVFCLMGEPAYKANFLFGYNLYMYKRLSQYDKVFSIIKNADNVKETQPYLGWFENKCSYFDWKNLKCQNKIKTISCISSDKLTTAGHKSRFLFVKELRKKILV